jgi:uncharacterized protein (DUF1499 family)
MDNSKKPRTGHTTDIVNTMEHMIDISSPMTARAATVHTIHTYIRHEIKEPLDTLDDVEFTKEKILAVIDVRSWQTTGRGRTEQRNPLEDFEALSHLHYRII